MNKKKGNVYSKIGSLPISKKFKTQIGAMIFAMSVRNEARKKGYKKFSEYLKSDHFKKLMKKKGTHD